MKRKTGKCSRMLPPMVKLAPGERPLIARVGRDYQVVGVAAQIRGTRPGIRIGPINGSRRG